jgi:hypothetical protein
MVVPVDHQLLEEGAFGPAGILCHAAAESGPGQLLAGISPAQHFVDDFLCLPPQ